MQPRHHRIRGQCPDHQHVAVREIDQVEDAVHHRVAEGDQRIDAAEDEAVEDLLKENFHARSAESLQVGLGAGRHHGKGDFLYARPVPRRAR